MELESVDGKKLLNSHIRLGFKYRLLGDFSELVAVVSQSNIIIHRFRVRENFSVYFLVQAQPIRTKGKLEG